MNIKLQHLNKLEQHFRACACRSTTPFFSERKNKEEFSHRTDETGENYYRTYYQHDRDKILYSRSFRRLRLKTQIFPEHTSDHLRTRLDHTLEVAQIARHFARQLQLNEDLVDAIAIGHDIGHTPFAHSGERSLHRFLCEKSLEGFKHNWQGLRVVDKLEKAYPYIYGLNLTRAVRIGILKHTRLRYREMEGKCSCDIGNEIYKEFNPSSPACEIFEVQVTRLSDEIAQAIHDFEDAIVSDSLSFYEIKESKGEYLLIKECIDIIKKKWKAADFVFANKDKDLISLLLSRIRSELIFQLTLDATNASKKKLDVWESRLSKLKEKEKQEKKFNDFIKSGGEFPSLIGLDKKKSVFKEFKEKLKEKVIKSERVSRMDGKADYIIRKILEVYLTKPGQVPQQVLEQYRLAKGDKSNNNIRQWPEYKLKKLKSDKVFIRAAVDYVAGMTDRFALREFDQLYSPYPRIGL